MVLFDTFIATATIRTRMRLPTLADTSAAAAVRRSPSTVPTCIELAVGSTVFVIPLVALPVTALVVLDRGGSAV